VLGLIAASASAQQGQGPCKTDIEKFCKGLEPNSGQMIKCLSDHQSELSEACRQRRAELMQGFQAGLEKSKAACQADIDKLCKGVPEGEGRVMRCLREHVAELSEPCRKVGAEARERRQKATDRRQKATERRQKVNIGIQKVREACRPDVDKFCKGVKPVRDTIRRCLKDHESELSDSCKSARAEVSKG